MAQEPSQTEILQVVSSYAEFLSSEGKAGATLAKPAPAAIAARLKETGARARKLSPSSRALSGTMWCAWGFVLTAFLYVADSPAGAYVIAWAVLCYGVYQVIRGVPDRI